ncbi:hypothetical protein ESCAB7627_0047 [Escherichia albertii TW07627]|uniref:Uncharacterized protein n=1 Tax=Escherichia albertii (strain TW07627) TaxID=502347 RepID=A0ABC9NPV1_ESCAT|nr:hypothetical protein ESCAB7627_0047 [Escherichia albertii TW07627]OSL31846.1 hypothetical protein EAPG_00480 [Escherichia albertii B156]
MCQKQKEGLCKLDKVFAPDLANVPKYKMYPGTIRRDYLRR